MSAVQRTGIEILNLAMKTIDRLQPLLNLAPVPGLSSAASSLSALIELFLTADQNTETIREIANRIDNLISIIQDTADKAQSVSATGDRKLRDSLADSPKLKERIDALKQELDRLREMAIPKKGCLRILCSVKNSNTLLRINQGIDQAITNFRTRGGISVELAINNIVKAFEDGLDEEALKNIPRVNASYSSGKILNITGTLGETRAELLKDIIQWSLRLQTDADTTFICVLRGWVGTGKSAIAFEIAKRLKKAGRLGASFFFVRGKSDFNTTTYVLTSIAYQLAYNQKPSLYPYMAKAVREYYQKGKEGEKLDMDLENLIIKALKNVKEHHPIVLVLDALDECTPAAQDEIIRLLSLFMERLPEIPFPVRVFVTTRPEMKLDNALNTDKLLKVSKSFSLHEIPEEIAHRDIKLFLGTRLSELDCWNTVLSRIPNIVEDLTNVAAGLFMYADIVIKLLKDNKNTVTDVLDALLSGNPAKSLTISNLDEIYNIVLENALDSIQVNKTKEYIPVVLGSLALLQDQISTSALNDLVGVPERYIHEIVGRLGSVILKPKENNVRIRILHASFPQFLVHKDHCINRFYIDPPKHHKRLALACLNAMNKLERNICKLDDPTIMKSNNSALRDTVNVSVHPSLRYSCVHWITHLSLCEESGPDILDAVINFARTKLLEWVEVLSYMEQLEVAVPSLLAALSWCEVHMQDEDRNETVQLIDDMHRLVLRCYSPINNCPEHLYISAFPLAPSCPFTNRYTDSVSKPTRNKASIKSLMLRNTEWGPRLHTIPINAMNCCAVLSTTGKLIASGSSNGEVCIWDASIGLLKRTLKGHTKSVCCVSWAPDGESLASGSADGTICVWNAISGTVVHTQTVQTQEVQSTEFSVDVIAWSRDGRQLVTCANPGGVQVWDIVIGKELKMKRTFPAITTVLAISEDVGRALETVLVMPEYPGHTTLVRESVTRKLRVWDIGSDENKIPLELPLKFFVEAAVFLSNGTQIALSGYDDVIHVWDLVSGNCTSKFTPESKLGHTPRHRKGMAVSKKGTLASSFGGQIHFFNTKSWNRSGSFKGSFHKSASFSPDDRHLLTSFVTIELWDTFAVLSPKPEITSSTPSSSSTPAANFVHGTNIHFVAVSSKGSRVAAVSDDAVSIWSLESPSQNTHVIPGRIAGNIAFSPDAQKIAVPEFDLTRIWDISKVRPTLEQSILTKQDSNTIVAWSPDGRLIAGPTSFGLGVFNMGEDGKLEKQLVFSGTLSDLEFSADNTMLYAKCNTAEAIFELKEGKEVELGKHRWVTEIGRRKRFHNDAWIVCEDNGKRLFWVEQRHLPSISRWNNFFVVGKDSGKLDILRVEESST